MLRRTNKNLWKIHFRALADTRLTAPVMFIDANSYEEALKIAKRQSGLSRFTNWQCA